MSRQSASRGWSIPTLLLALVLASPASADPRDELFFGTPEPAEEEVENEDATASPLAPRDDAESGPEDASTGVAQAAELRAGETSAAEDERDALFFGDEDGAAGTDERDAIFFDGEGDDRDALFFGDEEVISVDAPSDTPVLPDETRDEGRLLGDADIDGRLGAVANRLDIGGLLYLRMHYGARTQGNPETFPVGSPNLLDVYLDARPSDRLRAFVRGRVTHTFLDPVEPADDPMLFQQSGSEVALDQLWIKFDVDRRLFVTAGRQPIRWGAGRFWNPTDFLNPQRLDPLAVFDERLGVSLLKLHLPIESDGWNFYAVADFENAARADEVGGALRVEKLIGLTEISATVAARKDRPLQLGADLSFPIWLFDFRVEAALLHDVRRPFWRGPVSLDPKAPVLPTAQDRRDEWIPQVVVGAEIGIPYGDDDAVYVGAEYFHNGMGYEEPELYTWLLFTGDFTPLYLGRRYFGVYASAQGPGSWNDTTLIASLLGNLSDGSFLARFDWRVRLLTFLDLNTYAALHFGNEGEFHFGLDLPPVEVPEDVAPRLPPGLGEALGRGISVSAPLLDLGVGIALRF